MAAKKRKSPETQESFFSDIIQQIKAKPFIYFGTFLILIVIFIAFVFGGINFDSIFGMNNLTFGYYNGVPISFSQGNYFAQIYSSYMNQFQGLSDDPQFFYMIWEASFFEAVVRAGLLEEMRIAGFTAPEDVVDMEVAALAMFQENGRFSAARYRSLDNNTRMEIWREVQDGIALNYLINDIGGMRISNAETAFIGEMASNRRSFEMVSFSLDTYPDYEVIAYAMANPDLFTEIHLSIISIYSNEREAQQVYDSVINGTVSFEDAARNNSHDMYADRGGDMGIIAGHELRWEIAGESDRERIMNLGTGSISELVRTPFDGWAFFRVNQSAYPIDIYDEFQLMQVRNYIMGNERGIMEDWLVTGADTFRSLSNSTGFYEALEIMGLTSRSFGPIPINFGDTQLFDSVGRLDIPELAGAGSNMFFWDIAFSTPLHTVSIPRVINSNVILLYPTEELSLSEVEMSYFQWDYPRWISNEFDSTLRSFIINSPRLDNRFVETFRRIFPDVYEQLWWMY